MSIIFEKFVYQYKFRRTVNEIFVPKNNMTDMSNPEFLLSKLTVIIRACCVYIT